MKRYTTGLSLFLAFIVGLWVAPPAPHLPQLHGYVLTALRGPDGTVKQAEFGHNLITNAGKDAAVARILDGTSTPAIFNYVAIGTNATAEAATDTALGTECASSTRQQDTDAAAGSTGVTVLDVTFAAGNCTATVTEMGVFNASSAGTILNHKTFGGIAKGSSDSLQVTVTFTLS